MIVLVVEKVGLFDVLPFGKEKYPFFYDMHGASGDRTHGDHIQTESFVWGAITGTLFFLDDTLFTTYLPLLNGYWGRRGFLLSADHIDHSLVTLTSLTDPQHFDFGLEVFEQSLHHAMQQKKMLTEGAFLATISRQESYFFDVKNLLFDVVHFLIFLFSLLYENQQNKQELLQLIHTTDTPAEFAGQAQLLYGQKNPLLDTLLVRYELMIELVGWMSHLLHKAVTKNPLLS